MNKVMLKWTPAVPLPNKDNIISSGAKANNEKGFAPSYETEGRPNMFCLLSNEYMRTWFRERAQYEKEVYTKKEMMKEESKIKRRFVQKDLTRREKKKSLPIIKLKRFQNIASKTDNRQDVRSPKEGQTTKTEQKKGEKEQRMNKCEQEEEKTASQVQTKQTSLTSGKEPHVSEEANQINVSQSKGRCESYLE